MSLVSSSDALLGPEESPESSAHKKSISGSSAAPVWLNGPVLKPKERWGWYLYDAATGCYGACVARNIGNFWLRRQPIRESFVSTLLICLNPFKQNCSFDICLFYHFRALICIIKQWEVFCEVLCLISLHFFFLARCCGS